jgi:superfamily II DNA/RNA helicase
LDALEKVQTDTHVGHEVESRFDPAEARDTGQTILLPNVRLANGLVAAETRKRLLLAFNTPLFPEILIASSVLAEGVDLHLSCRHVIHHDLCWNPSTLEQRTGRVDRLGSKAECVGASIEVYLPYVAATQDEKMYRVVCDRERWFQVIMGESIPVDEQSTDRCARRVALPRAIQNDLTLRLQTYHLGTEEPIPRDQSEP